MWFNSESYRSAKYVKNNNLLMWIMVHFYTNYAENNPHFVTWVIQNTICFVLSIVHNAYAITYAIRSIFTMKYQNML